MLLLKGLSRLRFLVKQAPRLYTLFRLLLADDFNSVAYIDTFSEMLFLKIM